MPRSKSKLRPLRSHSKARSSPRSYTPLSDALSQPLTFADTELAAGLERHPLVGFISAAMRRQRRADGTPLSQVICALLVWPLMKVKSIHCFCNELCQIMHGKVSVLYDYLGREDINSTVLLTIDL